MQQRTESFTLFAWARCKLSDLTNMNILLIKSSKGGAVKRTHLAKMVVGCQVEVFDVVQVDLQLVNGRKHLVHHVCYSLSHPNHDSHHGLYVVRQNHLKEKNI